MRLDPSGRRGYGPVWCRSVVPYAKITGIGRTTDTYNLADPDPEGLGIARAMALAVESTGLQPERIGYINPHGAGTAAGDGPESWAMHSLNPRVRVSATKSNLGHSMGATGAIETAVYALTLKEQVIPLCATLLLWPRTAPH